MIISYSVFYQFLCPVPRTKRYTLTGINWSKCNKIPNVKSTVIECYASLQHACHILGRQIRMPNISMTQFFCPQNFMLLGIEEQGDCSWTNNSTLRYCSPHLSNLVLPRTNALCSWNATVWCLKAKYPWWAQKWGKMHASPSIPDFILTVLEKGL